MKLFKLVGALICFETLPYRTSTYMLHANNHANYKELFKKNLKFLHIILSFYS